MIDWLRDFGLIKVKVKEESKLMYNLCLKRAESIGHTEFLRTNGKVSLLEMYKSDMLKFLIYLSYADGKINKEEVTYINILTGMQFDENTMKEYADRWNLGGVTILETPPYSLAAFVKNNIGPETGEISSSYYDLISLYVTTFNYIGNDLISCNKDVCQGEIDALSSYIMMLHKEIDSYGQKLEDSKPTLKFKSGSKIAVDKLDDSYDRYEEDMLASKVYSEDRLSLTDRSKKEKNTSEEDNNAENKINLTQTLDTQEDRAQFDNSIIEDDDGLNLLLNELNELTGMESVKKEINNLVNLLKICKIRKDKGLKVPPTTNHLVFLGNPGTGKTTVARILSKIYHGLGVLSKGHLVEVDRSGLVAGYMGQTGEKVMEVVNSALGGILFIDEAYALSSGKQEGDFGQEAVDILNKAMEDYRDDLIVIVAGYHNEMQDFLDANPGLRSRFNRTIEFPNYSADELITIMKNRATKLDYTFEDEALTFSKNLFDKTLAVPPKNFGNARSVRNYLEKAINNQANRLVKSESLDENELTVIKLCDVRDVVLS